MDKAASEFMAAMAAMLAARGPALAPFVEFLAAGPGAQVARAAEAPTGHPARVHLAPALGDMAGATPRLAGATAALAPALAWRQVFDGEGAPPTIAEGMLAAQVVGPVGLVGAAATGCVGLFLIAPGVRYPLHTHEAEEVYLCLHGRLDLQYGTGQYGRGGQARTLAPGEHGHTPPHRVHSLATGAAPVLLAYVWVGELNRPNWIWEAAPGGGWTRANWSRRVDGSWARVAAEPVTEALLAQAEGR